MEEIGLILKRLHLEVNDVQNLSQLNKLKSDFLKILDKKATNLRNEKLQNYKYGQIIKVNIDGEVIECRITKIAQNRIQAVGVQGKFFNHNLSLLPDNVVETSKDI